MIAHLHPPAKACPVPRHRIRSSAPWCTHEPAALSALWGAHGRAHQPHHPATLLGLSRLAALCQPAPDDAGTLHTTIRDLTRERDTLQAGYDQLLAEVRQLRRLKAPVTPTA